MGGNNHRCGPARLVRPYYANWYARIYCQGAAINDAAGTGNKFRFSAIAYRKLTAMDVQNNNQPTHSDLVNPPHAFGRVSAIGGFVAGLMISFSALIIAAFGAGDSPSVASEIVAYIGLATAVVSPFLLGYWFGKITWRSGRVSERDESLEPAPPVNIWYGISGRVNRLGFFAVAVVATIVFYAFGMVSDSASDSSTVFSIVIGLPLSIVTIGMVVPGFSALIRRLHDMGFSGWYALALLIPITNGIIFLTLWIAPGNNYPNKYGPQPPKFEIGQMALRRSRVDSSERDNQ